MKLKAWLLRGLFIGVLAAGLGLPTPTAAGSPIGGSMVISAQNEEEVSPAVAYNSQRQEYLVVWYNDRPGNDDIRAQRVSINGALIGGPFYISAGPGADRRYPDVAYNSQQDQYLVVWEHYDNASLAPGYGIYGRRVSGKGEILDANDIVIRSTGANLYTASTPAVAYASTEGKYLVVWSETFHPMPITHGIYGQVIDPSGALSGSLFPISEGTGSEARQEPDLAYNRHANRYLVVWQQDAGALWDIHGQQVHGGGGLYQGDITIAYYTRSSTAPAVASIPTTPTGDKFLVAFELDYAPGDRDIYGRLVAEDGTPGKDFWISWATGVDESSPAITGMESTQEYFIAWQHPRGVVDKPILGRSVSFQGDLGSTAEFPGPAAENPGLATGPGGDLLVAWQDQPISATHANLYGSLWGNRLYLPALLMSRK